jgi:hypothetical protein
MKRRWIDNYAVTWGDDEGLARGRTANVQTMI